MDVNSAIELAQRIRSLLKEADIECIRISGGRLYFIDKDGRVHGYVTSFKDVGEYWG